MLLGNYLTNRHQRTSLFGSVSDIKPVNIGVPQGSIVGPIMFIIYVNDIPNVLEHSTTLMYADDTVLYCADLNVKTVRKKMQKDLDHISKWCLHNRLTLNVSKTKFMTHMSDHKRKNLDGFRFYMQGSQIEEVDVYRYLGTLIDNRLNGDKQFAKTSQLLGLKLRTFGRIRRFLNTNAALTVYKSTILPLIDYNDHFQNLCIWTNLRNFKNYKTGVSE